MNKTEQKAFNRIIREQAHKSVIELSDVSFAITQDIFLELCKAVRSELDERIKCIEKSRRTES